MYLAAQMMFAVPKKQFEMDGIKTESEGENDNREERKCSLKA